MAVGATGEGSASRGVNGDQKNNDADDSGAVYVYVRSKGAWTPQAFLKASNADSLDQFGTNVALSADGNTLVVGAYFEDGGGRGVNGNQPDNSIGQAGAAYVFVRRGTTWTSAGVSQGIEPGRGGRGRHVRLLDRRQRRWQHGGGRGAERGQQRQRYQRQPG